MSGVPVRVAVQPGAATIRVAGAEAEGAPWLVAQLPGRDADVPALLTELMGPLPAELVLVHPGRWPRHRIAEQLGAYRGLAGCVRAVPAPLAAAGRGAIVVVDVGASGAEVVRLGSDGAVLTWRRVDVGGRLLDERLAARLSGACRSEQTGLSGACRSEQTVPGGEPAAAEAARRIREALSLLPAVDGMSARDLREVVADQLGLVVAAVQQVLAVAGPAPVLLVGGVARSPLLAELLDEAGIADVTVAARPDAAAVLGALGLPPSTGLAAPAPDEAAVAGGGAGAAPDPAATGPETCPPTWLPPLPRPRRRRLRAALLAASAAITVAALVAAGRVLAPDSPPAVPSGALVQYGYRLDVPPGWEHTGGLPERRRVLITPTDAPDGSDLIAVERSPLGYDAGAEPQRARAELRAEFDAAVAGGAGLDGYRPDVRFAGRTVTTYRQDGADGTAVEWFVVLDGPAQLSVGCRHTAAGVDRVRAACAVVVASVRRA